MADHWENQARKHNENVEQIIEELVEETDEGKISELETELIDETKGAEECKQNQKEENMKLLEKKHENAWNKK